MSDPTIKRPVTRGECANIPRPCPFTTCRYHLDIEKPEGYVSAESCALDVADRGGATLDEIGVALGVTRERVRQLADTALARLKTKDTDLAVILGGLAGVSENEVRKQAAEIRIERRSKGVTSQKKRLG